MKSSAKSTKPSPLIKPRGWFIPLLLLAVLAGLFWRSFLPDFVHFSNDGPLGVQHSTWLHLPEAMTGQWYDLNSIGQNAGTSSADFITLLRWVFGPVGYAKFLAPVALWILGLSAWFFFRQSGLTPLAAVLGGLAAMLSSTFFSDACWGVASHEIAYTMDFCALGLFAANSAQTPVFTRWVRLVLAGLAVGVNVIEAADIGAILSVFVALFVFFKSFTEENGPVFLRAGRGIARVAVIAAFAVLIAAQTIVGLVSTSINGIAGAGQDAETKARQWDFATQWSLPKKETFGLFVPGLFGYRMDTPQNMMPALQDAYKGGNYWGGIGRTPAIDRYFDRTFQPDDSLKIIFPDNPPQNAELTIGKDGNVNLPLIGETKIAPLSGLKLKQTVDFAYSSRGIRAYVESPGGGMRFSGTGEYVGILVTFIAVWAIAQSFRRQNPVFTGPQRKFILLGAVFLAGSLLLAWGRFAPFYQFVYALPYASTIRNPAKFLIVISWVAVILFGYGVHGLSKLYLQPTSASPAQLKNWWSKVRGFDRRWTQFSIAAVIGSIIACLVFVSEKPQFVDYLKFVGFPDENFAKLIADFSIGQVVWFILLFALSVGLVLLIIAGVFSGKRARLGGILLGTLLVLDLGRANLPWIVHWNYKQKYEINSLNPVVKLLAEKPYEQRVAELPFPMPEQFQLFSGGGGLYGIEWMQHLFPYYDVQSLDKVQMPREPADLEAFERTLTPHTMAGITLFPRYWQLTSTRYLLGPAGYLEVMNEQIDPAQKRFRIAKRFSVVLKPGVEQFHQRLEEVTAVENENGDYALFEFTGALPKAKLYTDWQANAPADFDRFTTNGLDTNALYVFGEAGTNGFLNLQKLASPSFDPEQTVLLDKPLAGGNSSNPTNQNPGTVGFKRYDPQDPAFKGKKNALWKKAGYCYAPTDMLFDANATAPSVLLLNDKFDLQWRVLVDGKPAELLRCNFIMRGVVVPAGPHTVEFVFKLPDNWLYLSTGFTVAGIFLVGFLIFSANKPTAPAKKQSA